MAYKGCLRRQDTFRVARKIGENPSASFFTASLFEKWASRRHEINELLFRPKALNHYILSEESMFATISARK
jgi:hypothetical protein